MRIAKIIDKLTLPIFDIVFLPNRQILLNNCPVVLGNHLPLGFSFSDLASHKKINYTDRRTGTYTIESYYYHRGNSLWHRSDLMDNQTRWIAVYLDYSDFYIQLKDVNLVNNNRKMSYCLT